MRDAVGDKGFPACDAVRVLKAVDGPNSRTQEEVRRLRWVSTLEGNF